MKQTINKTLAVFAFFLVFICANQTLKAQTNQNQHIIENLLNQSFQTNQNQFSKFLVQNKELPTYWKAYALMYSSIYHLKTNKEEQAENDIEAAIALLENKETMDSEDHALLGSMYGYSISMFKLEAIQRSMKASNHYEISLKKNKNNMRAFVGLGESDYYKPTIFGGGKKVESLLKKALSLPVTTYSNGPSWGRNNAYYMLIKFYRENNQEQKSKSILVKAISEFPNDYRINQIKSELITAN